MKKLALFVGLAVGMFAHKTQAQNTTDYIQDAIDQTIINTGVKADSACFSFFGNTKDSTGARERYILKLLYDSPSQGRLTKSDLTALKIFKYGTSDQQHAGHASYFGNKIRTADKTKESDDTREAAVEDFYLNASNWVANISPERLFIAERLGCPAYKK